MKNARIWIWDLDARREKFQPWGRTAQENCCTFQGDRLLGSGANSAQWFGPNHWGIGERWNMRVTMPVQAIKIEDIIHIMQNRGREPRAWPGNAWESWIPMYHICIYIYHILCVHIYIYIISYVYIYIIIYNNVISYLSEPRSSWV